MMYPLKKNFDLGSFKYKQFHLGFYNAGVV